MTHMLQCIVTALAFSVAALGFAPGVAWMPKGEDITRVQPIPFPKGALNDEGGETVRV